MKQSIRPGRYPLIELCRLSLTDDKLSQVEGGQGIEETLILMEERKSAINLRRNEINAVMK